MKNLLLALLTAIFVLSSGAGALAAQGLAASPAATQGSGDKSNLPAVNAIGPGPAAENRFPIAQIATGIFTPDGDTFHPTSPTLSLYIDPSVQWYTSAILQAAARWSSACGVDFERVNGEPPAAAPPGRTIVVVESGANVLKGSMATTHRQGSSDGNGLVYARVVLTDIDGDANRYFVLLHEMGHAFGMPHANDPAAVMHWKDGDRQYYIAKGTRATVTSTDLDGCRQLQDSAKLRPANWDTAANRPFLESQ